MLIAAPSSAHKNYCFEDWLLNARRFNCDIFIVDNTWGNKNKELYKKHNVDFAFVNPYGKTTYKFICESQNVIRDHFLKGDYTHLFFIETDLFPPKDILSILLAADVPVISAPYFIYKHRDTIMMNQEIRVMSGMKSFTRNYSLKESFNFMDGSVKRCYASGFGCTLIKRRVLELLPFRIHGDNITGEAHSDSFFYADLFINKINAYLYMGHTITHYNQDWSKILLEQK